jgi:tryptophan 2,3-dioxygenase
VERIIGPDTGGTGGTLGARYLQRTVSHRFLPRLWAVRAKFFGAANPDGDSAVAGAGPR